MKNSLIVLGLLSILGGVGFYYFNENIYTPQKQASQLLHKGMSFFEQNNTEALQKAIREFATAAIHFPQTQEGKKALFYLARSYEKLGMSDLALSKYAHLLDEDISAELKQEIRYQMARSEILRAYQEKGLGGLRDMLIKASNKALRSEIYTTMARHFSRIGNTAQALLYYEKAAEENNGNLVALQEHSRLAQLQTLPKEDSKNNVENAKEEKFVAPPVFPQKEEPVTSEQPTREAQLAKQEKEENLSLHVMMQKILTAIESLKDSLKNSLQNASRPKEETPAVAALPLQPDNKAFPAAASQQNTQRTEERNSVALQKGIQLYEQNLDAQAQGYFDDIIRSAPDSKEADDALNYAGNIAFRNNDYTAAVRYFNECISNGSRNRDEICYIRKGEAYYQRKDYVKAANVFETVQKLYPRGQYAYLARDWETEAKDAYFEQRNRTLQLPQLPASATQDENEQGVLTLPTSSSTPKQNIQSTPKSNTPSATQSLDQETNTNPFVSTPPSLGQE